MKDSYLQSLIRGRIGATILALIAALSIAFGLSPEDSAAATDAANSVFTWIGTGSALLSSILALLSKLRQAKE